MPARKGKVLVAMSGGVDSSVAAALLLREGYDVVGCFMRLGSPGETFDELEAYDDGTGPPHAGPERSEGPGSSGGSAEPGPSQSVRSGVACNPSKIRIGHQGCCSINDAADARLVAAKLDIPFYVCNFKKDFGRIIDYFVGEYNAGRTPNPCVRCNDWLKFGRLHKYAKQIDADFVASGHYARIDATNGAPRLLRGLDADKDQSYVLFGAPRKRLKEMLLPIGHHHKDDVREMAREMGLPVFDKPDSQEICFVPDNDYAGLVKRRSPEHVRTGKIVDTSGAELGEHEGHQHYTIGQRRGIGVALGYPIYVVEKDAETNTITVGEKDDLKETGCTAGEANWLLGEPNDGEWIRCTAKIRYNASPVPARVRAIDKSSLEVRFHDPQFAVAPGQAVVCYDGDAVICGGWIQSAF